jgi:hypothetical protein
MTPLISLLDCLPHQVRALVQCELWCLHRASFQRVADSAAASERRSRFAFLRCECECECECERRSRFAFLR